MGGGRRYEFARRGSTGSRRRGTTSDLVRGADQLGGTGDCRIAGGATDYLRESLALEEFGRSICASGEAQEIVSDCMIGDSLPMREIREYIGKAAASDSNVLITGKTGPARSWWRS
jgi:hypothetical protein